MNDATERWLPIPGYEGFYEASDLGRIRSVPRKGTNGPVGRILKPARTGGDRLKVTLSVNGRKKQFLVHRLVAVTFIGPQPSPDHEVCHNNGNPANNTLGNLRWDTHSENMLDSVRHGTHNRSSRTRCDKGHELTAENTSPDRGGRDCLVCKRERGREAAKRWYWRQKAKAPEVKSA